MLDLSWAHAVVTDGTPPTAQRLGGFTREEHRRLSPVWDAAAAAGIALPFFADGVLERDGVVRLRAIVAEALVRAPGSTVWSGAFRLRDMLDAAIARDARILS